MAKSRNPRGYDGTSLTTHPIGDLLPSVMRRIGAKYKDRPDLICAAWPEVIGPQLAPMTEATGFDDGCLYVTVKNSTLYSVLQQQDKARILKNLRQRFPRTLIKTILFRNG